MTRVLLLLGSNIDSEVNFCRAARLLAERLTVVAFSQVYESAPVGDRDQPRFLNAAALIETDREPEQLRGEVLQRIEGELGRVRGPNKNAPRTIDLDVILFGERVYTLEGRHVPEPELYRYAHIAVPAADVAPDWAHPETGEPLREIAARLGSSGLTARPDLILIDCTD
jgi:2-amino-4-hydroxy-6-hydroxymethyldihydropteridine diphosphokinase